MEIDPLFKIKQIFGSVENFESILEKVGSKNTPIIDKITTATIESLREYKEFASKCHIDIVSKGLIVHMLRDCYQYHLDKVS